MTAALITAASIIVVAVIGIVSLVLRQKFTTTNDRRKTLQTNRERAAKRFRPLMTEIIATVDTIGGRAHVTGKFATDFQAFGPQLTDYFSRLNAEGCKPLADNLAAVVDKGNRYGFIERRHFLALTSGTQNAAIANLWSACDTAWAELHAALTTLTDGLHAHMKMLDTPVS